MTNERLNILITQHARQRIDQYGYGKRIYEELEKISNTSTAEFFKTAKIAKNIHTHNKDQISYLFDTEDITFVFFYNPKKSDLVLVTIRPITLR